MKPLLCMIGFGVGLILATATKLDLSSPAILVNIAGVVLASASLYRLTKCEMPKTKKE
jgi:hypothetical protein